MDVRYGRPRELVPEYVCPTTITVMALFGRVVPVSEAGECHRFCVRIVVPPGLRRTKPRLPEGQRPEGPA